MNSPTAMDMLTALSHSLEGLLLLVTAISYVSGIALVIKGILGFKAFGQHTNMMGQRGEVAGPMVSILVGSVLIFLPTTLNVSFYSFFQELSASSLTADQNEWRQLVTYANAKNDAQLATLMQVLLGYTKLIGLIAFVRGWHLMSHIGGGQAQHGSVTKGLVHLLGGIIAMNGLEFINVLARTLGYKQGIF